MNPIAKALALWVCLNGFLAVALGAFGAHGLKAKVSPELLAVWRTAVEYQFYHLLPLSALVALMLWRPEVNITVPAACLVFGTVLFSGSLYALVLTGIRALGAITPLGGLLLLAGWAALGWRLWQL